MNTSASSASELQADCSNCFALCCVSTAFVESKDFAFGRMAGVACPNLEADYRCRIHDDLRTNGMRGCTTFDCFGAGQKVSNVTFKGRSWNESTVTNTQMILVFSLVRQLHELLWYLSDAWSFSTSEITKELDGEYSRVEALSQLDVKALFKVSSDTQRDAVFPLLIRASEQVRSSCESNLSFVGKDLSNKTFAGVDLRGADLSAAMLVGADLSNMDLASCDVLQANFKDANVRGADLSSAIYLTQMQLNNSDGNASTIIGPRFYRPAHWSN